MLGAQAGQVIWTQLGTKRTGSRIEGIVLRTVRLMGFLGRSH